MPIGFLFRRRTPKREPPNDLAELLRQELAETVVKLEVFSQELRRELEEIPTSEPHRREDHTDAG